MRKAVARSCHAMARAVAASLLATTLALPAAAGSPVTIQQLIELTDVDGLGVSPDGRVAVFRTQRADVGLNTYVLRWHSVDLASGEVRDIGSGGEPIYLEPGSVQAETPLWAADGRTIIVRALVDGAIGLWRGDVGGHGMTPLVVGDADVLAYALTPDRAAVDYQLGSTRAEIERAERREYDDGILVDRSVDLAQNLYRGGSVNGRMASQRLVGTWFVRDGLLWRTVRQHRRIDLATGRDVVAGAASAVAAPTLPPVPPPLRSIDRDGNVAEYSRSNDRSSLRVSWAGGGARSCNDPRCASDRISSLVWRPGSREVLVTFVDDAMRQSLALWDPRADRLRLLAAGDGLLNGGRRRQLPCAVAASAATCIAAGPASPPRVERIDLETGRRTILFDPNAAFRSAYQPRVRNLSWPIGNGQQASGVLLLPQQGTPAPGPLYLNYYVCEGFLRGGEGDEWPIPALLDAGYAVACINSLPFTPPQDAVRNYRTGLAAVRALIDQLAGEGLVDRQRVAMGGLSFGSEVATWIAWHSDLLAALSITSPQAEPASYWYSALPDSDMPPTIRRVWGYGAPEETPARWRTVSPALNVARMRLPVLFQMPEMEARRVSELYARLARAGTPTELYAFADEAHFKVQPRHRFAANRRNLDWFRYWLEKVRDPDPAKADQYRRWDALRLRWKRPERRERSRPLWSDQ